MKNWILYWYMIFHLAQDPSPQLLETYQWRNKAWRMILFLWFKDIHTFCTASFAIAIKAMDFHMYIYLIKVELKKPKVHLINVDSLPSFTNDFWVMHDQIYNVLSCFPLWLRKWSDSWQEYEWYFLTVVLLLYHSSFLPEANSSLLLEKEY